MAQDFQAPTSVSVPSADLINYRFDQSDKKFDEMGEKLDRILVQNAHFVSESDTKQLITEALKPYKESITNYRWYLRALFVAFVTALGTAIAGLFINTR